MGTRIIWVLAMCATLLVACVNRDEAAETHPTGFATEDPYSPYTPAFGAIIKQQQSGPWVVEQVSPGSPAALIGIVPGDTLRQVGRLDIEHLHGADLSEALRREMGISPLYVVIERTNTSLRLGPWVPVYAKKVYELTGGCESGASPQQCTTTGGVPHNIEVIERPLSCPCRSACPTHCFHDLCDVSCPSCGFCCCT
jgi:hypothetical protein